MLKRAENWPMVAKIKNHQYIDDLSKTAITGYLQMPHFSTKSYNVFARLNGWASRASEWNGIDDFDRLEPKLRQFFRPSGIKF